MAEMCVVVNIYNIKGESCGVSVILRTNPEESIAVFKRKIENRAWPPTHVDCITHNSIMMEAHKKMGDYGIRHGSTIVCHPFFTMEELAEARGQPLPPQKHR